MNSGDSSRSDVDSGAAASQTFLVRSRARPDDEPRSLAPGSLGEHVARVNRIVASEDRIAEAAAEVLVLDVGRVVRQAECPHVFDANVVRHPRLDLATLDESLERLSAPLLSIGARHVQIACDRGPLDPAVAMGLGARGFDPDRLLAMVLPGAPARHAVRNVQVLPVTSRAHATWYARTMDRMSREETWYSERVSSEIIASLQAKRAAGALALYVAMLDRRPVGAAGLALDRQRGVAAITSVGTVPEARHRGVAQSMVVTLANHARAAGCDLIYLLSRAADTPKDLYRKLGFEVLFGFDVWLRPPG